jgi:hypothetical protein
MGKWDQILAGNLAMKIPFLFINEFICSFKGMITTDYFIFEVIIWGNVYIDKYNPG